MVAETQAEVEQISAMEVSPEAFHSFLLYVYRTLINIKQEAVEWGKLGMVNNACR